MHRLLLYNRAKTEVTFATKVSREKRIPFEVSVDPFYSESNMNYLRSIVADIESGKAKLVEHDLIEEC